MALRTHPGARHRALTPRTWLPRVRLAGGVPPRAPGATKTTETSVARAVQRYDAARNIGYTVRRAAPFVGKALALARERLQGLGPPPGPLPKGAGRRPSQALPRTKRSRGKCRLLYAPHGMRKSRERRVPLPALNVRAPAGAAIADPRNTRYTAG